MYMRSQENHFSFAISIKVNIIVQGVSRTILFLSKRAFAQEEVLLFVVVVYDVVPVKKKDKDVQLLIPFPPLLLK